MSSQELIEKTPYPAIAICHACTHVLNQVHEEFHRRYRASQPCWSAEELIRGNLNRCWLCTRICDAFWRIFRKPIKTDTIEIGKYQPPGVYDSSRAYIACALQIRGSGNHHFLRLEKFTILGRHQVSEGTHGTDSDESFAYIASRLDNCRKHHSLCHSSAKWNPTRLIATSQKHGMMHARIVSNTEISISEPYITLSHCWGSEQPLRLTSETFEAFRIDIPWKTIPALFDPVLECDSGIVTSKSEENILDERADCTLHMRPRCYDGSSPAESKIRMDRFVGISIPMTISYTSRKFLLTVCIHKCIIQDSVDDWRHESSRMENVYRNGLFNIAAAEATSSRKRLFNTNAPLRTSPILSIKSGSDFSETSFWSSAPEPLKPRQTTIDYLPDGPLFKRAWVVQERLLANRTFTFTKTQIHYRCAQEVSCESVPPDHALDKHPFVAHSRKREQGLCLQMKSERRCYSGLDWNQILEQYHDTEITNPGDRLIALSGIARHFSKERQCRYLAGLWENTFVTDMAWFAFSDGKSRPQQYVAPTWSWASVKRAKYDTSVLHSFASEPTLFPTILEVQVQSCGKDKFGEVRHGWLKVRAPIFCVGQKADHGDDTTHLEGLIRAMLVRAGFCEPLVEVIFDHMFSTGSENAILNYYLMPLTHRCRRQGISGLLLAAVTPSAGNFQRVGYCRVRALPKDYGRDRPASFLKLHNLMEVFKGLHVNIPSHYKCLDGQHIITII